MNAEHDYLMRLEAAAAHRDAQRLLDWRAARRERDATWRVSLGIGVYLILLIGSAILMLMWHTPALQAFLHALRTLP